MERVEIVVDQMDAEPKTQVSMRSIARAVLAPLAFFSLVFLLAGRWDFWQGWVYLGVNLVVLIPMAIAASRDPGMIEERLNPREGMKSWDKLYFGMTVPLYIAALVLGGLAGRFGWLTQIPLALYWASVGVYLTGQAIFLWARFTNRYFSSVVRIQTDRGQTVCRDGPYRFVRHPGYVGGFLFTLTSGIILGSWLSFIPQVVAAAMIFWRTAREDQTLMAELPGYLDYAQKTRFRLIPGIW